MMSISNYAFVNPTFTHGAIIGSSSSQLIQQHQKMGFGSLLRERANSLRLSRPRLRPPRSMSSRHLPLNLNMNMSSNPNNENQQTEPTEAGPVLGPSQAPTEAGVSTAGLNESEAAFLEASYKADVQGIQNSLEAGVDVNTCDVNGRSCLHFCAGNGLQTLVRDLGMKGAALNKQDLLGYTPLHLAAGYRMSTTVRALLDLGADANIAANDGKLAVELVEDMLERTAKKRFFMDNPEYGKLKDIVSLLDEATELEEDIDDDDEYEYEYVDVEDDDDDDDDDEADGDDNDGGDGESDKRIGANVLQNSQEKTEKVGDTTFTVRVKSTAEGKASSPAVNTDNGDVKFTVKEPGSSNNK